MEYLHTMVRVTDLDQSLDFYCGKFGLVEVSRIENEKGRYTLVYLAAPGDADARQADENGRSSSSPIIGTPKSIPAGAISAIWPLRSMIFMRSATNS